MTETFFNVNGEGVIPGAGVRTLSVHAVEWNWNAKARWIAGSLSERDLISVTACGCCKRRIWSGTPEEIEKCGSANEFSIESSDGTSEEHSECLGSDDAHPAGTGPI